MANQRVDFPEFDLMLQLVKGEHTSEEAVAFFQALDATCGTRWLCYFDPSVDLSKLDVARLPAVRRVIAKTRRELFGEAPKAHAIVCDSEAAAQFFFGFWRRYFPDDAGLRCFHSLDEAYDWLGLSDDARAEVASAIEAWQADAVERREPATLGAGTHVSP